MASVGNSNSSNSRRFRPRGAANPAPAIATSEADQRIDAILNPRRRLGGRKLGIAAAVGIVALLLIVALAPTIVAKSALRDRVLNSLFDLDGELDTAGGSLGWFSPVVLYDVALFDRDDYTVAQASSLTSSESLLGLIFNGGRPGMFTLTQPVLYLELHETGSNLEDVLRPMLADDSPSSTEAIGVQIVDGTVNIHDRVGQARYQLQQVELGLALDKRASPPMEVDCSASMPTDSGRAQINLAVRAGDDAGGFEQGLLDCQIDAVPIELLAPFVRRALPGAKLSGRMAINAHGTWGEGADRGLMSLQGRIQARDFTLTADALGTDQLQLARIDLPCRLEKRGTELRVQELALRTDVGQAAVEGTMLVDEFTPAALLAALQSDAYRVEGRLDLARLAAQLPNTLRIRQGTQITEGTVQAVFTGERQTRGIGWQGRIETVNLRAKAGDSQINWQDPLVVQFAAHQANGGTVVDSAEVISSFLKLQGSGTVDDLQASGQFDLERLMNELERFIDLGQLELAGAGEAKLRLRRTANEAFSIQGDFSTRNFALAAPDRRAWRERNLSARIEADGRLKQTRTGWELAGIERLQLTCEAAAGEKLTARLLEPIEKLSAPLVPLEINWQGPLDVWLPRVDPWMSTVGWELTGNGAFKATAIYRPDSMELRNAVFAAKPFRWKGAGLVVDERQVDAAAQVLWDTFAQRLEVPNGVIEADTVLAKLTQAELRLPERGTPTMAGTLRFDADLAQLNRWTQDPQSPSTRAMSGKLSGQAVINRQGRDTAARLDATIANLSIAEATTPGPRAASRDAQRGWQERQLAIKATANYLDADDRLEIERAEISSSALQAVVAGRIDRLATDRYADLSGTLNYDWQTLAPFWRPYLGQQVNIVGRESRKFSVRGMLPQTGQSLAGMLMPLTAELGAGWEKAEAYGLPIGRGELVVKLDKGVVTVQPIDVAVSDGRFTLAPRIRIAPEPGEITLPKGPVLTQIRFTPEITDRLLKYAAPVLAQTARIDGQFSIDLEGGRFPLENPERGDFAGRLTVHTVNVTPGPLAQQLLALGKQVEDLLNGRPPVLGQTVSAEDTLLKIESQTIEVQMVDRRVYHRGLSFQAGKLPIRTYGSVGLDESLMIMAEVTVPTQGIGKGPLVDSLKGKTLQVPISGTLSKPKLDDSAISKLGGQLLENTARDLIQEELGKQLDRLIPKR